MKTNKAYFLHQLKTNLRPLIVISICVLILGFYVCSANMDFVQTEYYNDEIERYVHVDKEYPNGYYYDFGPIECETPSRAIEYRYLMLGYPITILILLCYIVPVWLFAFMKKRRNLDCCYSLPISRRSLGLTNYLVGLVLIFVPFLLTYITNLIMYASYSSEMFLNLNFGVLATHFLISVLMGLVVYTLFVFVFNEANSVLDGCIFMIAYTLEGMFIVLILDNISYDGILFLSEKAIPFVPFVELLSEYETALERGVMSHIVNAWAERGMTFCFIFWIIASILAFFGFVFRLERKKAEKTEDISTSIFGYKTLIPLVAIPAVISLCEFTSKYSGDPISCMFVTLAAVVAYTVYRRGVKYKKSDYAVIGILLLFTVISASI